MDLEKLYAIKGELITKMELMQARLQQINVEIMNKTNETEVNESEKK